MIPSAIILLVSSGIELVGSFIIGMWRSDVEGRSRAGVLAQWSMATSLLAIGILLLERLI